MTPSTPTSTRTQSTTRATSTSEHSSALFSRRSSCWWGVMILLAQVHWVFHLTSFACRTWVVVFDSLRSLSTSTCPSPSSSFPLSWCSLTCRPTSTTRTPWKMTCADPAKGSLDAYDVTHSLTKTFPIGEGTWTDFEPGKYSISDFEVSKKWIKHRRHGTQLREEGWVIDFWRLRDFLQNHCVFS